MDLPPIVSAAQWQAARDELLVQEKEATRALDALAARRRRLPMVRIDKDYVFGGEDGQVSLPDLFGGRRQLIVYHFMLAPGSDAPCAECSSFTDNISTEAGETFGLSVFLREGDSVFRSYFTSARGVDRLRMDFNLLDLTPLGRQEEWEDSLGGWPQTPPYQWWRLHDEYVESA